jgi:hypothetical protein
MMNDRVIELIDEIRNLDGEDMILLDGGYPFPHVFRKLESVFREFYNAGYENGSERGTDPDIDFSNRLTNFYQYRTP